MEGLHPLDLAALIASSTLGLISFLSCICVELEALADWRDRGKDSKMVTRTQVVLQFPMALLSLMLVVSIFMSNYDAPMFMGNDSTCQLDGFLIHIGLWGAVSIDAVLSLSYLLMIKCEWKEEQLRRLEMWPHFVIWPLVLGSGIYLLLTRSFEPSPMGCWILECDNPVCEHEKYGAMLTKSMTHIMGIAYLVFSVYVMCAVSKFARQTNQAGYVLARRGLCFAGGIVVLQMPNVITLILSFVFNMEPIRNLSTSTFGLAGCFNMLVFLMYRRKMRTCYGKLVRRIVDALACVKPEPQSEELVSQPMGRDLFMTTVVDPDVQKTCDDSAVHHQES